MRNRIDTILLGLLWLLAATLGTSFWMNTRFGFNIFSAQHWQYLAYLQASHTPVQTLFYVSLTLALIIMVVGLYMLVRPRLRKIRIPRRHVADTTKTSHPHRNLHLASTPQPASTASTVDIIAGEPAPRPVAAPQTTPPPMRPPRLNIPTMNAIHVAPMPSNIAPTESVSPQNTAHVSDALRKMFTDAGYVIKSNPKIGPVRPDLFAIGTNENLWIGAVGIKTTDMRTAVNRLAQVFSDTLDDIEININAFVIGAPDAATSEFQDILMFDSAAAVGEYIAAHPNPPLSDDDAGNFDAYSAYISTVIDYIGTI